MNIHKSILKIITYLSLAVVWRTHPRHDKFDYAITNLGLGLGLG